MFALPERYMNWMIKFIEHHLLAGHIRPSKSPISAGTWMIPKKGRTDVMPRVVHDYRALNENTIKDHTPLPRQDQILCRIARAKLHGYIDLPDAYYQMHIHPDDVWKTAFKTPFGICEWLVMPQGLCNMPATWQRYMNWVLRDEIGRICCVYVDDIVIFSDTLEEHHRNVRTVLQKIREAGIYLSPTKSNLYTDEIEFLGHIISSKGLEVMLSTTDKIADWLIPQNVKDIKSFNGLVNYIAEFIPRLTNYSSVLSDLTRKGKEFKWEGKHQQAFDTIKLLAKSTPVYRPIDYDNPDPIFMVADASNWAVGGYYGQGKDYKTMQPAGFHSR